MRPQAVPGLRRLTDAIHAEGALAAAQLGHAGAVANSVSNRAKALGPSRIPAPMGMSVTHKVGVDEIPSLRAKFAESARLAVDSGFDALEIHCGHNYLISSFLSPLLSRRRDAYGGPLVNRARLAREVLETVREAVRPGVAIWAKLNMFDGVGTRTRPLIVVERLQHRRGVPGGAMAGVRRSSTPSNRPPDRHCSTRCTCSTARHPANSSRRPSTA